ncbi:arginine N-succinyltransferase [Desulforhopalus singaporensis]|uniref:Arginine N-succinyltransferase n=1 Tax=Desulforhopalus singaporensis TaxID=91360 RepID=A0A1H0JAJ1_9BACT|nr:arginine N-succinyltransferase [Desulforhopalus singaporensis]SDO40622.1 hypothetical protein SAMN05660330_00209 [Desulforhopalus singaporensis]
MSLPPPEHLPTGSTAYFSTRQVVAMIALSVLLALAAAGLAVRFWLFPPLFEPVILSPEENRQLEAKLASFSAGDTSAPAPAPGLPRTHTTVQTTNTLTPEKYHEEEESRTVILTEREINGMLAKNTDLADKVAVDLAEDTVSLKLLLPLDPDLPILGGKTLKVAAGAEIAFRHGRPVVKLKGVSLMGVPMPNSWLGGMKNIDLIQEFGTDKGFWKGFSDGVKSIAVVDGSIQLQLKE